MLVGNVILLPEIVYFSRSKNESNSFQHKKDMTVVWSKSELSELHGNLKKWVRGKNFQNLLTRKRLSYPTEEEFWKILNQAREELYLDKRIPFKNKSYLLPDDYKPDWELG